MSGLQRRRQNHFVTRHNMPGTQTQVLLPVYRYCYQYVLPIIGAWKVSPDFTLLFFIFISPCVWWCNFIVQYCMLPISHISLDYHYQYKIHITSLSFFVPLDKMVIIVNCRHHGWHRRHLLQHLESLKSFIIINISSSTSNAVQSRYLLIRIFHCVRIW